MDKYDILKEAIYIECENIDSIILKFSLSTKIPFTTEDFLRLISKSKYNLAELGISTATTTKLLREILPGREAGSRGGKPCTYLLSKFEYKWCGRCEQVHTTDNFRKNKANKYGLNTYCKNCHLETTSSTQAGRQSEYRCSKLNRTPSWANLNVIKQYYLDCPKGMAVDHIYPLQGKLVSGLHVENNLQYLSPEANSSKCNKFNIE